MDTFLPSLIVFTLGTAVGSFLNVVVYRLPEGLSLLYPPSRCPKCEMRLKPYDNVPVFGWLWLRGKCRNCKLPIAMRYALVEFATGCLFLSVFALFGMSWQTLGYWLLVSWLLSLALIDLDTMTLPNRLTASGLVLGWLFQGWISSVEDSSIQSGVHSIATAMVASVLALWLFDTVGAAGSQVFGKPAMGGGDAKLAAMMAAWIGFPQMLLATFLAATIGAVLGSSALALGLLSPKQHVPFGPYLALGTLLTLFYGTWLIETYLSIFFPVGL